MVTKKMSAPCGNELCKNPNCSCDPCTCTAEKCCNEKNGCSCSPGKCQCGKCGWGGSIARILIAVALIVGAYIWGVMAGLHAGNTPGYGRGMWDDDSRGGYRDDIRMKRGYNKGGMMMNQTGPVKAPMGMSMMDMSRMLEGKTGDALDSAFLEMMIPHHQGAIDMAKYLTGAKHDELKKLGADIIAAQANEIAQMQAWQEAWGYASTGATATGTTMHMMPDGTMMQ